METLDIERIADTIAKRLMIQPRWLKLTAAAQYASINRHRLKQLAIDGMIIGYQEDAERGDWIFDKDSIDSYRLTPVQKMKSKTKTILKSL